IGADARTDVALIKIDDGKEFPYVRFAEHAPRIGDWVLAVGNPFGLGGTVTAGIVSARGRDIGAGPYDDFIQIDAPVNKGNSGGPTFDVAGIVAGDVITAVNGTTIKDARDLARQIGALPPGSSVKLTVLRNGKEQSFSLSLGELPNQREANAAPDTRSRSGTTVPRLGLTLAPANQVAGSGNEGVVVTSVEANGVAAEHGVKTGDVILEVAGKKVGTPADSR